MSELWREMKDGQMQSWVWEHVKQSIQIRMQNYD